MSFPALATLSGVSISRALCRMVQRTALESRLPPNYLFTSGGAGRYNSPKVECIYASEDMPTAAMEYERYNLGHTNQSVTYWIHVSGAVIDLGDVATLGALGLTSDHLFLPWRGLSVKPPTITQRLGDALGGQTRLCGIRFPSDAARARTTAGSNYVFFRLAVRAPASVIVKDDKGAIVQSWP